MTLLCKTISLSFIHLASVRTHEGITINHGYPNDKILTTYQYSLAYDNPERSDRDEYADRGAYGAGVSGL